VLTATDAATTLKAGTSGAKLTADEENKKLTLSDNPLTISAAAGKKVTVGSDATLATSSVVLTVDTATLVVDGTITAGASKLATSSGAIHVGNLANLKTVLDSAGTGGVGAITLAAGTGVTLDNDVEVPDGATLTVTGGGRSPRLRLEAIPSR
jgi:hypothetical protein